jgi:diadenylate cyclase
MEAKLKKEFLNEKKSEKFNKDIQETGAEINADIKKDEKSNTNNTSEYKAIIPEKVKTPSLISLLKLIAPGTKLRKAIDDIVKARNGALIVVNAPNLMKIVEGGFKVNCRFMPQRLVELCKMDGAVILSQDMSKILYANVLLSPDISILSEETGIRHKAAQRTAKQFNTLTIAVSERRRTLTIYYGNLRYVLSSSEEVLRRAMESLQILEKQCEIFEDLIINLNIAEFTNTASLKDICEVIQRSEIIQKITLIINKSIAELGKQGILIKMRLKELTKDNEKEEFLVIEDYSKLKPRKTKTLLSILSFEEILNIKNIYTALGCKEDDKIETHGYRILSKLKLEEKVVKRIVKNYDNLNQILESPLQKLSKILKNESKAKKIQRDLMNLKEQVLLEKKI